MRRRHILIGLMGVVVGALLTSGVAVLAGPIDSPAGPGNPGSQMHTLDHIYYRIDDGTSTSKMTTFTEPSSGPGSTMHTLDQIYFLAGHRSRPAKTWQTTLYATGDDGDLQKGVAWPDPRFTDNGNGTVTDNLTGLIWLKNANCAGGAQTWATALSYANALYDGCTSCFGGSTDCGLSDGSTAGQWRLPNVKELLSLIHYGCYQYALPDTAGTSCGTSGTIPFTDVQIFYWSSTTLADGTSGKAWMVNMADGTVPSNVKTGPDYVWAVRGGQ